MRSKFAGKIVVLTVIALLVGCAAVAEKTRQKTGVGGGIITGGVDNLIIDGPSSVSVGETVTLKAVGYDAKQAKIKRPGAINPTWSVQNPKLGKLNKNEGQSVIFTGLAPGVCYIEAVQGEVETTAYVEVK
ncbi:MAG: hypothetical protein K9N34_10090 [Candidatus Marinimicrobia bacterium]|nr:hypothetical protein [Candidatus Neomarinimicrobiota bacterium]